MQRRFYDLGRINYWGQPSKIDWGFDDKKVLSQEQLVQLAPASSVNGKGRRKRESVLRNATACGSTDSMMHGADFTQEAMAERALPQVPPS